VGRSKSFFQTKTEESLFSFSHIVAAAKHPVSLQLLW
jgi:hypothetical protein